MFDALDGALCVLAAAAMMQALRTGSFPAMHRRVLWEIAALGAGVVLARAALLPIFVVVLAARFSTDRMPGLFRMQGVIAAAALGSTLVARTDAPGALLIGAAVALAALTLFARTPIRLKPSDPASIHFACAGVCALIGYAAGREPGALAVVIVSAMIALIAAHLAMALAGDAWPALISTLNGFAACSVVAAGLLSASGALLATGTALVIGCAAARKSAKATRPSYSK